MEAPTVHNDLEIIDLEWAEYSILKLKLTERKREDAKILIENGCEVNKPGEAPWDTPLHITLKNEDVEIMEMLLERGALKRSIEDDKGCATLCYALKTRSSLIVGKILDKMTEIDPSIVTNFGLSPLVIGCLKNDVDSVENLLRCGTDVNDLAVSQSSPLCKSTEETDNATCKVDWSGCTCLHVAIDLESIEIIKILLTHGADVNKPNSKGLAPLHLAVKMANSHIVSLLLALGDKADKHLSKRQKTCDSFANKGFVDVNALDSMGNTPLLLAVTANSRRISRMLIRHGADVGIANSEGSTPFYLAIKNKYKRILMLILKSVCNRNYSWRSYDESYLNPVSELVNFVHKSGDSLLHVAVQNASVDEVKWLLSHGAKRNFQNKRGLSPLHLAARKAQAEIVRLLLFYDYVCGDEYSPEEDDDLFYMTLPKDESGNPDTLADVNILDYVDSTPLHHAASNFSMQFSPLELLINSGADVSISNYMNQSPIHIMARCKAKIQGVKQKILNLMLNVDQSCKRNINPMDDEGFSHFHAACMVGDNPEIVESFLKIGAHISSTIVPNSREWPGYTPLHFAAENNCVKVAQLLIDRGAHVDVDCASGWFYEGDMKDVVSIKGMKDFALVNGKTPLHLAVRHGCLEVIRLLLRCGADVEAKDENGHNLVHEIVMRNRYSSFEGLHDDSVVIFDEILNLLLEYGCNINARNKEGMTPLHLASNYEHRNAVLLLLRNGADINVTNNDNATALLRWKNFLQFEEIDNEEAIPEIFRSHVLKLIALGLKVNHQNSKWYKEVYYQNTKLCINARKACLSEIKLMKKMNIDRKRNVLTKILADNSENVAKRVSDTAFGKFMKLRRLEYKFPKYVDFIRLQYKRCRNRWNCLRSASIAIRSLTKLPELCCREIAHNLSNKDLKKLSTISDKESRSKLVAHALGKRLGLKKRKINF